MKKFTFHLRKWFFFFGCLCFMFFSSFQIAEEPGVYIQNFLMKAYDLEAQGKQIKRYDINVTNTGFCRYRRVFTNGKEEYFAFNLSRFQNMDFYGTHTRGDLYIRTRNDDVIVQTRNDRKGEVDSTSTFFVVPLKNVEVEDLNVLNAYFLQMSQSLNINK